MTEAKAPLQILVVEDEPGDFGLLRALLRAATLAGGAQPDNVVWSTTLGQAVASAQSHPPDAVLLDLSLPDSSGLATVRRMRAAAPAST
ncbi:MAG: response regulator, partial [Rhodoferax sp.]|nr:response regulator [Rhodoferax sp.]